MSGKNKHIGLRCTDEILYKLKYIAEYEGRSLNGQLIHLINSAIKQLETNNGAITLDLKNVKYKSET